MEGAVEQTGMPSILKKYNGSVAASKAFKKEYGHMFDEKLKRRKKK